MMYKLFVIKFYNIDSFDEDEVFKLIRHIRHKLLTSH